MFYIVRMDALLKIIDLFGGNRSALARRLAEVSGNPKLSATHINNWIERDKNIPTDYVIPIAQVSEWKFTPHQIKPNKYPHPQDGLPDHLREVA
ncbi:hypothetical protein [Methylophilus sp.]|uniref:YdaS family helix-turn-helix protein n=1 Tax=Methylophilus sp. TaxID=29541 RepID=UPI000D430639|nr:hypothetical protein [Methylophilus sp.]PPD12149.1 MAG: hypothetical protein CTY26_06040 [Methylophilus sp.]